MASVRKRNWNTASGEAKAAWVVDYTDSRGERQRKHFSHKKAADAFRIQVEGQMQAGTYRPDADKVTVKEVCESFLEHCAGRSERDERMTRKMLAVYKGHPPTIAIEFARRALPHDVRPSFNETEQFCRAATKGPDKGNSDAKSDVAA